MFPYLEKGNMKSFEMHKRTTAEGRLSCFPEPGNTINT